MDSLYYSNSTLKDITIAYFYYFSRKDIDNVVDAFDNDIWLEDWENKAYTKDDVISVYQKIFNSVDSISVTPVKLYADNGTVIAQLLIRINGNEDIFVTDIITFDQLTGKIKSIQAYKG